MNVLVINGSPKSKNSVTYHHMLFLEKHYKTCQFEYLHITRIQKQIQDDQYIEALIERMALSDLVMFTYPVYDGAVPYQLMCLIESLMEHVSRYKLEDTYVVQFSTSKHFYDVTAYHYLQRCLFDLKFKALQGEMADMDALLHDEGRKSLISFFDHINEQVKRKAVVFDDYPRNHTQLNTFQYEPTAEKGKTPAEVLVIYNGEHYSDTLKHMIVAYENKLPFRVHLLDISNFDIKGGCIGCVNCSYTGHCIYNDEFEKMYREKILKAEVIIYASDITHHWLDKSFKLLQDRSFYQGYPGKHKGKGIGYLLVGPFKTESNLRMVLDARTAMEKMIPLGHVTNEVEAIEESINRLVFETIYYFEHRPAVKTNFYGVGGSKILRDMVYDLRGIMTKEHQYFKRHKLYDFPKRHFFKHLFYHMFTSYIGHPKRRRKHIKEINDLMIQQYKKQLERY